ncbi:hypothetical protein VF07_09065 [Nostoc linckia z6]|uniref:Uncharacterized protein n=1 Tax=Nostoc linckia z8 TaxID=1628746 RepID=A0A9Q6EIR8_NOSLI|nr:hypothetical protein VF05_06475 [Nostoc linckia z3]PHJ77737.1 hypothetical protein VF03_03600 [Nostoc linckia z2]PHJ90563.1 hypothetical protein VF07_09065 [Nostoc linckia z6]PHJ97540.1 hypothetical protein VF08_28635 [Nostoc linckia z8]
MSLPKLVFDLLTLLLQKKYKINFLKFLNFITSRVWEVGTLFRRSFLTMVESSIAYKAADANIRNPV